MIKISIYECKDCGSRFKNIDEVIDHAVATRHLNYKELCLCIELRGTESELENN